MSGRMMTPAPLPSRWAASSRRRTVSGTSWAMSTLMEVQSLRVPRMNSAVRSMAEP